MAQIQRPTFTINGADGSTRQTGSDVPDLISVQGTLDTSLSPAYVKDNASLLFAFRTGPPFKGTSPLIWTINGERGEIRLTSSCGAYLQSEVDKTSEIVIEVHNHAADEVTKVNWAWEEDWQSALFHRGRNLGRLYDLFAQGEDAMREARVMDFDGAVRRHAEIDALLW